jgi:hypothetical protein
MSSAPKTCRRCGHAREVHIGHPRQLWLRLGLASCRDADPRWGACTCSGWVAQRGRRRRRPIMP